MTALPIDIINKLMSYNSHRTAGLLRPHFIDTKYACYVKLSRRLRWLIFDDDSGLHSDAYEMYVRSGRSRHKHQVKYVS